MSKTVKQYQIHQELSNRNELPISENRNTTPLNNTKQTLTQEQKINLGNLKKIMNEQKTTLPSLRNIEWRPIKMETKKINQVLTYIPTKNITELNELINTRGKLVYEKIRVPLKSTHRKPKPGREIWLETQIRKLWKQAKMIKQRKNAGTWWNKKEKETQEKITMQLEKINQKVLVKEGRLKIYQQRVKQYRQSRTFQSNERKFYQQVGGDDTKTYQQPDAREAEQFLSKIWQPGEHNKKAEWISNMVKELEGLKEGLKVEIHIDLLRLTLKKYQTGKRQAMIKYMDSSSWNSPPYLNGWPKEVPHCSKNNPIKEPPQTTTDP